MTLLVHRVAPTYPGATTEPPTPRESRWPAVALFAVLSSVYFAVGAILMMRYNIFEGDGMSRVANAGFTLMSRDPHLSAVGFVWNPLPSLVQIPLMPFSRWLPELKTYGLTGSIQSSMFMAGAAVLVRRIALDRDTRTVWRWVAVGCFALNPVIIIYGGNGMSEAAEVFCILLCVRHLLRWVATHGVGDLAWAGIALGLGYLVRYEVIPAACGAAALVAVVAFNRAPRSTRRDFAALCAVIVCFPIAAAVAFWAAAGWIMNGELFAILSSQYGNASQVAVARARGAEHHGDWWIIAERLFAMQPFIGIAAITAAALSMLTKTVDALVPLFTFGAVLAFSAWGEFSGTTFGYFRYYVAAIPMVIVIALVCWVPADRRGHSLRLDSVPRKLGAALLCASLLIGVPVTTRSMLNPDIGNDKVELGFSSLIRPGSLAPEEQWYRRAGNDERLLAALLDRWNLSEGSVLMDTFVGCGVWLASDRPRQFVITSDYDFVAALNRPWDFGITYIVVTNPAGGAAPDAINKRYPMLWDDGAGFGTLAYSGTGPFGEEKWRVYRINRPSEPVSGVEMVVKTR